MSELDGQDDIVIDDKPVDDKPVDDKPVDDKPVDDKPVDDKPVDDKPVDDDDDKKPGDDVSDEKKKADEAVQKRINKVVYEKKVAEETLAAERAKREEIEKKLAEATKEELPDIPQVPDIMDSEYDKKMEERDAIIVKHAQDSANKDALRKVQQDRMIDEQKADNERVQGMIADFDSRTTELGLDKEALVESQNVVGNFLTGKTDLARFLLSDENGPLNVKYLHENVEELEKVSKMPETDAAVYIATKIAPEALKLKPKTTDAPAPPYTPTGKGKIEDEDPNLEGCTFE